MAHKVGGSGGGGGRGGQGGGGGKRQSGPRQPRAVNKGGVWTPKPAPAKGADRAAGKTASYRDDKPSPAKRRPLDAGGSEFGSRGDRPSKSSYSQHRPSGATDRPYEPRGERPVKRTGPSFEDKVASGVRKYAESRQEKFEKGAAPGGPVRKAGPPAQGRKSDYVDKGRGGAPSRDSQGGPRRPDTRPPDRRRFNEPPVRQTQDTRPPMHTPEVRDEEPEDKVYGINPVLELLRAGGRSVDTVYLDRDKGGKLIGDVVALTRKAGVTLRMAPREALDRMAGNARHQGVVAVVTPLPYADPDELVAKALARKDRPPILVILDGVEDPQNLGAIIRTVEASGADGVFIPERGAARLTAAVARASAGAVERVPVAKAKNLAAFIRELKAKGFWTVGLEGGVKGSYTTFDMNGPIAVVLGSEGWGIRDVVKAECDRLVSLPMLGSVGSLNVSVAAGIVLYEALRQRAATAKAAKAQAE